MKLLIVEDEPAIAMVLEGLLSDEGHDVEVRLDGPSGLERLLQSPRPDLVLVDLFMPGTGGREVVATMRANRRLAATPVILITGAVPNPGAFPPAESYQALVRKPFDVEEVLRTVEEVLGGPGHAG